MKIAIVTDTYFPRINGVSASTRLFAREFTRMGHEVHVHAPSYPGHVVDSEIFKVIRYSSFYLAFDPEDRMAYDLIRGQKKAFMAEKYDIVHTQTPFLLGLFATRWARSGKIKVVHTYHTYYAAYLDYYFKLLPKKFKLVSTRQLSKRFCNLCDLVVAPSELMRQEVLSYNAKTRVMTIPTGVDLDNFENGDPDGFRRAHGFQNSDTLLLFVGRLAEEKNIDFLLRVFKRISTQVPDAYFLIAGSGPYQKRITAFAEQMGLSSRVRFLGYIEGADLRDCYTAANVFMFASVTETQGLVLLESLACKTPIVAVGKMGVNDILGAQKGGVTVDLDEDQFCRAVMKMITDREFYLEKKREAACEAAKWSSQAMAKKMLSEYQKLVSTPHIPVLIDK